MRVVVVSLGAAGFQRSTLHVCLALLRPLPCMWCVLAQVEKLQLKLGKATGSDELPRLRAQKERLEVLCRTLQVCACVWGREGREHLFVTTNTAPDASAPEPSNTSSAAPEICHN